MKFRTVLVPALLLISFAGVAFVVSKLTRAQHPQGFTLRITQTAYPPNHDPVLSAVTVRYQKSNGNWKTETTYSNGRVAVGFAQPGRGVFHVDEKNQKLDYLSESNGNYAQFATDESRLSADPKFVGEETILGLKTFHLHSESDSATGNYSDVYICPALQGYPLRSVSGSKNGKTVFEVTQVMWGEPAFSVPSYRVDTSQFQETQATSQP